MRSHLYLRLTGKYYEKGDYGGAGGSDAVAGVYVPFGCHCAAAGIDVAT